MPLSVESEKIRVIFSSAHQHIIICVHLWTGFLRLQNIYYFPYLQAFKICLPLRHKKKQCSLSVVLRPMGNLEWFLQPKNL
jgi:hypothetical protein